VSSWLAARDDHDIQREVVAGVRRGEFVTTYQAVVDSRSGDTDGLHATVAWSHPTLGPVRLDAYASRLVGAPVYEELQRRALHEACARVAGWDGSGLRPRLRVSLSAGSYCDPAAGPRPADAVRAVGRALAESGLDPDRLVVVLEAGRGGAGAGEGAEGTGEDDAAGPVQVALHELAVGVRGLGAEVARDGLPRARAAGGRGRTPAERRISAVDLIALQTSLTGATTVSHGLALIRDEGGRVVVHGIDTALLLDMVPRSDGLYLQGAALAAPRALLRADQLTAYEQLARLGWEVARDRERALGEPFPRVGHHPVEAGRA
jgi:EAL domain-containing protein (putative c-di-GMP-specific phosphodiesterase class I)